MPTEQQHRDGDPPSQPPPSIGSPPSPSYASMAAGTRNTHRLKLHSVFSDPTEGHLAATALAPKGARLGDLVNPRAVAYIVPRNISSGAFSDAVRSTHSALFKAHDDMAPFHIISNMAYPCTDGVHHRIEIVYHESLDPTIVSTTPIIYDGTKYAPLSSTVSHIITRFVFTDYQFQSSLDFGARLEQLCSWYFEDTKKMGKVIKIEVPLFPTPNGNYEARGQFTVYVKSDKTAEACKIDRLLSLGSHQKAPCRISWMGASPFCNYCKGDGHLIPQCPKRLAIVCSACNANGHVSFTCSRFSARDAKEAKASNTEQPATTATNVTSQTQVVDLTGNESPSNTSNYDITMSKGQGQVRVEEELDDDISLKDADLEFLDREANNIEKSSPTNSPPTDIADDKDAPMEDAATNSVAGRLKASRTVVKPAAATTAKSTAKATNNIYAKGGRPINKATSTVKNNRTK
ncbi:MAG: hypothetical protein JOS17DRAFT_781365 [Linnemannia elongata]|nr:MAG: hypothetical protein JOS17DRAFT_781365 [Linnemannia elongata]